MASKIAGNTSIEQIKEKMKEKRRKKALNDGNTSWSKSFSKRKGTSASFILKASLRSNNQSLAKALAASKHDTRVAHQAIIDLQRDRQSLTQHANMTRRAEKDCIHRFHNIKQVLTKVTTSLLDAVTSLSQALDLCSSLPMRDSSLGILPLTSLTSDDDSFGSVEKQNEGSSQLCRKAKLVSTTLKSAGLEVAQSAQSVAKVAASLSEPTPASIQSQLPFTAIVQSQASVRPQEQTATTQDEQTFDNVHTDGSNIFTEDIYDQDLLSIDGVNAHIKFADDSIEAKDNGCSSRRPSSFLEPPIKKSRTSTFFDPAAIKKALAEDSNRTWTEDSGELDPSFHTPQTTPKMKHYAQETDTGPASQIQNHAGISTEKSVSVKSRRATFDVVKPGTESRRATFDIPQPTSEAPSSSNETFEVVDRTCSPATFIPPTRGKDGYLFVHSPPCNISNNKSVEMELTGEGNSSSSTPQDELNRSLPNKSRVSHDDQIIRPWGNIQFDKPDKPAAKQKPERTKSKLPKSSLKVTNKKGLLKESSKTGVSKKSKEIKKASGKSLKKTVLLSESFMNDLAVFDLSAGESFSIPSPIFKGLKPKATGTVKSSNKNDDNPISCYADEKSSGFPTSRSDKNDKLCPPVTEGEQQEPTKPQEPINVQEPTNQEPIHHKVHHSPKHPESVHHKEQLDPVQNIDDLCHNEDQELIKQNEKVDYGVQLEPKKVHKADGIKRKSKKARTVKTPSVDRVALIADVNSKLVIGVKMPENEEVLLDGTYMSTDQVLTGASAELEDNTASRKNLKQSKPKKRPAKSKSKTTKPSLGPEIVTNDVGSEPMELQDSIQNLGQENQAPLPKINRIEHVVTFASGTMQEDRPDSPSNARCETVDRRMRNISGRGKSRSKKKVCESNDHLLTDLEPVSKSPQKKAEAEHLLSLPTDDIKQDDSPQKQTTVKASSKRAKISKRGQKRTTNALEVEEKARSKRENIIQDIGRESLQEVVEEKRETIEGAVEETGRRSRRRAPVSYKEPSLSLKMRRNHSPDDPKKKKTKKVSKRTTLGTVTNVM